MKSLLFLLCFTFSTVVYPIDFVPLPDGRVAMVLTKEEIKQCKEQGGCNIVTKQQYETAVKQECKRIDVKGKRLALHDQWKTGL